jgi:hypothetical protein
MLTGPTSKSHNPSFVTCPAIYVTDSLSERRLVGPPASQAVPGRSVPIRDSEARLRTAVQRQIDLGHRPALTQLDNQYLECIIMY